MDDSLAFPHLDLEYRPPAMPDAAELRYMARCCSIIHQAAAFPKSPPRPSVVIPDHRVWDSVTLNRDSDVTIDAPQPATETE